MARIPRSSSLPLRFKLECGAVNWRLRGALIAVIAAIVAAVPLLHGERYKITVFGEIEVEVVIVLASVAVGMLSGPLAGVAYALSQYQLAEPYTVAFAAAAAMLSRRSDPTVSRLLDALRAGALPRPTGLAAAALAAVLSHAPQLPGGAFAIYAGFAAALAPSLAEAVLLGFLGGVHPALSASLGAYLAPAPRCYRCSGYATAIPARLVGIHLERRGFSCAVGHTALAVYHNPLFIVIGGYGIEFARKLASSLGAEFIAVVGKEDYEYALKKASESRNPVVIATAYLPETILPPAPGRDTAVIITGVRDPVYLERLTSALKINRRVTEVFASKPGLAIAYPGCHGEVLLLEWGFT